MKRLIFKHEVLRRVGLSYPTIWKMMREDRFPRSRVCGGKSAWLEEEIEAWIEGLPIRQLKGDAVEPQDDEFQKMISERD
jgi:predicted DNA-binding transcriptional regulator AlpA